MNTYIITGTADGRKFTMAITAVTEKQARELCRTRLESSGFGQVIITSSKLEQE